MIVAEWLLAPMAADKSLGLLLYYHQMDAAPSRSRCWLRHSRRVGFDRVAKDKVAKDKAAD